MRIIISSEGQPETIVQDIEAMVRTYVEKVIAKSYLFQALLKNLVSEQRIFF